MLKKKLQVWNSRASIKVTVDYEVKVRSRFEKICRTGATNNQPQVQIQIHHQHWSPTPPAKFGEFGWIKLSEEGNLKWQD